MMHRRASHSRAVLLPLGVRLTRWLTRSTVHDSEHRLLAESRLFGMQLYRPDGDVVSQLRVRYRSWWALHQVAGIVVDLEPDPSSPSDTAVSVSSGLRVGAAIALLVWDRSTAGTAPGLLSVADEDFLRGGAGPAGDLGAVHRSAAGSVQPAPSPPHIATSTCVINPRA